MDILLKIHKRLDEKEIRRIWEKGVFIFDTNVLLGLYRFEESSRQDLLRILNDKKINDRVWLPFQVFLEFFNKRLGVIADQKTTFDKVRKLVNETLDSINVQHTELKNNINNLQLKKRHSLIDPSPILSDKLFFETNEQLKKYLSKLDELDSHQPDVHDVDDLQSEILKIFENKIGKSFSSERLKEIQKEGEERFKEKIPPGFEDDDKTGFYLYEDKMFFRKYGDLVIWQEIIEKAKDDKLEFVVFITNDSKKDWLIEKRGKKVGVRYELLNEIYFKAETVNIFQIYNLSSFMSLAKEYLGIQINDTSIKYIRDWLELESEIRKQHRFNQNPFSLARIIKDAAVPFSLNLDFIDYDYLDNFWTNIESRILLECFIGIFELIALNTVIPTVKVTTRNTNTIENSDPKLEISFSNLAGNGNFKNFGDVQRGFCNKWNEKLKPFNCSMGMQSGMNDILTIDFRIRMFQVFKFNYSQD